MYDFGDMFIGNEDSKSSNTKRNILEFREWMPLIGEGLRRVCFSVLKIDREKDRITKHHVRC